MHNPGGRELEMKVYLIYPADFRARVAGQGAVLVSERVREWNLRYDTPDGRLEKAGQVLRLRKDDITRLTFKSPPDPGADLADRQELEVELSDFDTGRQILEALGYRVSAIYEKVRTTWHLDGCEVTLDEMPYGTFCEVEGPDAETIRRVVEALGLQWQRRVTLSYLAIFAALQASGGIGAKQLVFADFKGEPVIRQAMAAIGIHPADD